MAGQGAAEGLAEGMPNLDGSGLFYGSRIEAVFAEGNMVQFFVFFGFKVSNG